MDALLRFGLIVQLNTRTNSLFTILNGESDALIVSGLISILRCLYNGLPVSEVITVNFENEMDRLGLREHLSSQRSNGLRSMVNRIRHTAKSSLLSLIHI